MQSSLSHSLVSHHVLFLLTQIFPFVSAHGQSTEHSYSPAGHSLKPRKDITDNTNRLQCFEIWPDPDIYPTIVWPRGRGPDYYRSLTRLCAFSDAADSIGDNMGCICHQRTGHALCLRGKGDPLLYDTSWLLELCRDNCGCPQDPESDNEKGGAAAYRYQGGVSHAMFNTPMDPDSETSGSSGMSVEDLNSRLESLSFTSQTCYGECSPSLLGCGELGTGCRCIARRRSHNFHIIGCMIPVLSSLGGKRDGEMDPDEGCPCNSTYISHGCCEAFDGIVFESPQLKLGELEEAPLSSISLSQTPSDSSTLHLSTTTSNTPKQTSALQLRSPAYNLDRGIICHGKPVVEHGDASGVFPDLYPLIFYPTLLHLCQSHHRSDTTMGCMCLPGNLKPTCLAEFAAPDLFAIEALRERCEQECDCPREANISEYEDPEPEDDRRSFRRPGISGPNHSPGVTYGQQHCRTSCTGGAFSCFTGRLDVKEHSCRCALDFVGPGLWSNSRCVSMLHGLQSLGGRDVDSAATVQNDLVCPCNSTYVSKSCCDADEGLVWESPHLKLGRVV